MAVHISLDLDNCTFGQLLAFVDAVESAGAHRETPGRLDGSTLHFSIEEAPRAASGTAGTAGAAGVVGSAVGQAASAAASNLAHVDTAKLGDAVMGAFIDAFNNKRR